MERDENNHDLIELAIASETTKGAWGNLSDEVLMHEMRGLADD
jgi:hypothetical protein